MDHPDKKSKFYDFYPPTFNTFSCSTAFTFYFRYSSQRQAFETIGRFWWRVSVLSQSCIDWNRDVLKRELGLEDDDIIDLPILFKLLQSGDEPEFRAVAYYPDMVRSDALAPGSVSLFSLSLSSQQYHLSHSLSLSGEHDCVGEKPGHPEALWPPGEWTLCPGGRDDLPDGGPGPVLLLHRRLCFLPQTARGSALRLQRPQGKAWLQVVEPRHVKENSGWRWLMVCSGRERSDWTDRLLNQIYFFSILKPHNSLQRTHIMSGWRLQLQDFDDGSLLSQKCLQILRLNWIVAHWYGHLVFIWTIFMLSSICIPNHRLQLTHEHSQWQEELADEFGPFRTPSSLLNAFVSFYLQKRMKSNIYKEKKQPKTNKQHLNEGLSKLLTRTEIQSFESST